MPSNDNNHPLPADLTPLPDPHGQAALLLVESLIHGLCENATLNNSDAIDITQRAAEIQQEQAEALDGAGAPAWRSHSLLMSILTSFRTDGDGLPPMPRLAN